MTYAHTLAGTHYSFDDLRTLLARATPFRSGDALAGLAATTAARTRRGADGTGRRAAREHSLPRPVVPYETDEVTRLIVDSHDAAAFAPVGIADRGRVPRVPARRRTQTHWLRCVPASRPRWSPRSAS